MPSKRLNPSQLLALLFDPAFVFVNGALSVERLEPPVIPVDALIEELTLVLAVKKIVEVDCLCALLWLLE